jgi:NAD(P)-dependent dehydrogenase (short-subunit alcohol dehydrogenase family)
MAAISSRNAEACAQAQDELSPFGEVRAFPADLSRHDECRRLSDLVTAGSEPLDILVNNAGAMLTRVLARERGPQHVTVNAVAPGPFPSTMMAATLDELGEAIAASAPLRRIGRDDDMAGVAVFLASRAGAYLTGAVIPVDGGITTTA